MGKLQTWLPWDFTKHQPYTQQPIHLGSPRALCPVEGNLSLPSLEQQSYDQNLNSSMIIPKCFQQWGPFLRRDTFHGAHRMTISSKSTLDLNWFPYSPSPPPEQRNKLLHFFKKLKKFHLNSTSQSNRLSIFSSKVQPNNSSTPGHYTSTPIPSLSPGDSAIET